MTEYDVVVIGTGTAGQTAAYELNSKGLNVAVVEKSDRPGGTCALAGCQAKKWFYEGVEVIAKSHHLAGKGILSGPHFAWGEFLGAHILSDNASGIVNTIRLAVLNRIPVETLYRQSIMSPYPSRESDML